MNGMREAAKISLWQVLEPKMEDHASETNKRKGGWQCHWEEIVGRGIPKSPAALCATIREQIVLTYSRVYELPQ